MSMSNVDWIGKNMSCYVINSKNGNVIYSANEPLTTLTLLEMAQNRQNLKISDPAFANVVEDLVETFVEKYERKMSKAVESIVRNGFATDASTIQEHSQFLHCMTLIRESLANLEGYNNGVKKLLACVVCTDSDVYFVTLASGAAFDDLDDFVLNHQLPYKGKVIDNPASQSCFRNGIKNAAIAMSISNGGRYKNYIGSCPKGSILNFEEYEYISIQEPKKGKENIFTIEFGCDNELKEILARIKTLNIRPNDHRNLMVEDYTLLRAIKIRPSKQMSTNKALKKELAHHLSDFAAIGPDVDVYIIDEIIERREQTLTSTRSLIHVHPESYGYKQRRTLLFEGTLEQFPINRKEDDQQFYISGDLAIYWESYVNPDIERSVEKEYSGGVVICPMLSKRYGDGASRLEKQPIAMFSFNEAKDLINRVLANRCSKVMKGYEINWKGLKGSFYIVLRVTDQKATNENGEIDLLYLNIYPNFVVRGDISSIRRELQETLIQFCIGTPVENFKKIGEFSKKNLSTKKVNKYVCPPSLNQVVPSTTYLIDPTSQVPVRVLEDKDPILKPLVDERLNLMIAIKSRNRVAMDLRPRYHYNPRSGILRERIANVVQPTVTPLDEVSRNILRSLKLDLPFPLEAIHSLSISPFQILENVDGFLKRNEDPIWVMSDEIGHKERGGNYRVPHIRSYVMDGETYDYYCLPDLCLTDTKRDSGQKHEKKYTTSIGELSHEYVGGDLADLPIVRVSGNTPILNDACPICEVLFGKDNNENSAIMFFVKKVYEFCQICCVEDFKSRENEIICPAFPSLKGSDGMRILYINKLVISEAITGNKQARKETDYRGAYWIKMLRIQGLSSEHVIAAKKALDRLLRKLNMKKA